MFKNGKCVYCGFSGMDHSDNCLHPVIKHENKEDITKIEFKLTTSTGDTYRLFLVFDHFKDALMSPNGEAFISFQQGFLKIADNFWFDKKVRENVISGIKHKDES